MYFNFFLVTVVLCVVNVQTFPSSSFDSDNEALSTDERQHWSNNLSPGGKRAEKNSFNEVENHKKQADFIGNLNRYSNLRNRMFDVLKSRDISEELVKVFSKLRQDLCGLLSAIVSMTDFTVKIVIFK